MKKSITCDTGSQTQETGKEVSKPKSLLKIVKTKELPISTSALIDKHAHI